MSTAVRIPTSLAKEAKAFCKADNRSFASQISYWAKIGKIAEENPDLSYKFIKDILLGTEELDQGLKTEYEFS